MQSKESKTQWHFWISFVKSCVRIFAGFAIIGGNLTIGGISLILAEILGILEEL
jgi:hypothetical protein